MFYRLLAQTRRVCQRRRLAILTTGMAVCLMLGTGLPVRAQIFDDAPIPGGDIQQTPANEMSVTDRLTAIDETLRLLNRRMEVMPIGGTLPPVDGGAQQELLGRLETIENQLLSMSQPSGQIISGDVDSAGVADLRVRLTQIEEVMRSLNGQLEDVAFRLTKFSERFEQVTADTEFRFQELEIATRQQSGMAGDQNIASEPQVLGTIAVAPGADVEMIAKSGGATLIGEQTAQSPTGTLPSTPSADGQSPKDLYDLALGKLRLGAYEEAQKDLKQFLSLFPKDRLAGNAQYWLGETYYVQRNYKEATAAFLTGYTDYADSVKAPDSLLKLGMTLLVLGEKKTGCDAFAELSARFPDASQSIIQRAEIESQRAECL